MRRRDITTLLGVAVATWPLAAVAQQQGLKEIGYIDAGSLETRRELSAEVVRGLAEHDYVEGRNLTIHYRWADFHLDRLPKLAADLVRRQVAAIVAAPTPAAFAAIAATKSIPVVFLMGADPVETGLVASLNRPGGNVTGIALLNTELAAKRIELLRELVPTTSIGYLGNSANRVFAETETKELEVAAAALGVRLVKLDATDSSAFEHVFEILVRERVGALVVGSDVLFSNNSDQLVALAARHSMPAIYAFREATAAGGLLSYATDRRNAYRQLGSYASRILNGEKPADLPVQRPTKFELVINLKTAKAIGLTVPDTLLARADEVIE
jgi:ABC-type uncharacterized transport system substrate-binding protein